MLKWALNRHVLQRGTKLLVWGNLKITLTYCESWDCHQLASVETDLMRIFFFWMQGFKEGIYFYWCLLSSSSSSYLRKQISIYFSDAAYIIFAHLTIIWLSLSLSMNENSSQSSQQVAWSIHCLYLQLTWWLRTHITFSCNAISETDPVTKDFLTPYTYFVTFNDLFYILVQNLHSTTFRSPTWSSYCSSFQNNPYFNALTRL